jgi:hypothetical protein
LNLSQTIRNLALDSEAMALALEATGDYRVLRKIQQRNIITPPDGTTLSINATKVSSLFVSLNAKVGVSA